MYRAVRGMGARRAARRLWTAAGVVALLAFMGAPCARAATGPALAIDAAADNHPISQNIYGLNFADPTLAGQIGLTVDRWGGDDTDVYNWRLGATNQPAGNYENTADCFQSCPGPTNTDFAYIDFLKKDRRIHAAAVLTLPLVGSVAKDAPVDHPFTCSYPSAIFPVQTGFDPYDACGSGYTEGAALAETYTASGWSLPASAPKDPAGTDATVLTGVGCTTSTACTAVGFSATLAASGVNAAASHAPVAERWNGSGWKLQALPAMPTGSSTLLSGVACPAANSCTAAGETAALGAYVPLVEHWNGTSWSVQALPAPSGAVASWLTGIACPATTACMAIGTYLDSAGAWRPFAERASGTSWSLLAVPAKSGATMTMLSAIACSSTSACTAVGSFTRARTAEPQEIRFPLAERWNGSAWTIPAGQPATPASAGMSQLSSVACPATTSCMAVGFEFDGNAAGHPVPLAESWSGSSWTIRSAPHAGGSAQTLPFAVACASASACTMVGSVASGDGAPQLSFAERWNGTGWSAQTPANPPGASPTELAAVACPAGATCLAVGFDFVGQNDGNPPALTTAATVTGTQVGTSFDRDLVTHLVQISQPAQIYELGNEPDLWGSTHHDLHPSPETARELTSKSLAAADAVKTAQPGALVDGFAVSGWFGLFCSGADTADVNCDDSGCTTSPDCGNHAHIPMVEYFLNAFRLHDAGATRHLDYIDTHYYPQTYCYPGGGGGFGCPTPTPPSTDVTRSLWDPSYPDPGWIGYPYGFNNGPTVELRLLPRIHAYVSGPLPRTSNGCPTTGCYPGTRLAITEYNLSDSLNPVVNALIQADTLGIFARERVDLATRWPLTDPGSNAFDGCGVAGQCDQNGACAVANGCLIGDMFRLYRDYDGAGARFGNTWIRSTSTLSGQSSLSGQGQLAVYAAKRTSDGAVTVIVINKTASSLTSPLALSGFNPPASATTWRWTGSPCPSPQTGRVCSVAATPISGATIKNTYPARSITLYVIHPAG